MTSNGSSGAAGTSRSASRSETRGANGTEMLMPPTASESDCTSIARGPPMISARIFTDARGCCRWFCPDGSFCESSAQPCNSRAIARRRCFSASEIDLRAREP